MFQRHGDIDLQVDQGEWVLPLGIFNDNKKNFIKIYRLRLPCTFRGVSSLTDVAHAPYIADIVTPYQIKAYKIYYKKIAKLFDSNESVSFLRPIYEDVVIAFHEL